MNKIFIVNAHWSNRGDEAALRPIVKFICKKYKDVQLHIIFKENQEITSFPEDNVILHTIKFLPESIKEVLETIDIIESRKGKENKHERTNLEENSKLSMMVKLLLDADLIIYSPGGSVISSRFWWVKQMEYLVPFICAEKKDIPMVVAAPSIGPFENTKEQLDLIKKYLLVSKQFCVREDISKSYLSQIGITENVKVTIDTAFYDKPDDSLCISYLNKDHSLESFLNKHEKVVGITISDFAWHIIYRKNIETNNERIQVMQRFVEILNLNQIGVVLIPQLFGCQNDKDFLEKFRDEQVEKSSCAKDNIFILSDCYDTYFQQYIISKMYAVIGMRYHSNIFAAKMGVPFIAISYEEKMEGFMNKWDMSEMMILLDQFRLEEIQEKWDYLQLNYDTIKKKIKKMRNIWHNISKVTIDSIDEEIGKIINDESSK